MLEAKVNAHGRFQVELKVSHPLPAQERRRSHEVDIYFFAPRSLGIRRANYSKTQFFADLQSYLRLTTPAVQLDRFVDGAESPIAKLRAVIDRSGIRDAPQPPPDYERAIKLFCSMLKSAARNFATYILGTRDPDDRAQLLSTFVQSLRAVCQEYRSLRSGVQLPGVADRTLGLYLFGDEWLSLLVEDHGYRLMEKLREAGGCDVSGLMQLVDGEVHYRGRRGYPSIPDEQSDNEELIFRRSVLKKYMASILFLRTEFRKEGQVLRETLFGVAAAVAMIFATAVAFATQSIYGTLTPAFFGALVVSYVFKDRIKDLLRSYLWQLIGDHIFDRKTIVRDAALRPVGVCHESFEFLGERRLPKQVQELRERDHITEIENGWLGEQAFVYKKRVSLDARAAREIFPDYEVRGVTDILRFSVLEFLRRMDDPKKELFVMEDEGYQRIKGTRVYHLNLVLRLRGQAQVDLRRYRVVLNRKGIKRVELVRGAQQPLRDAGGAGS